MEFHDLTVITCEVEADFACLVARFLIDFTDNALRNHIGLRLKTFLFGSDTLCICDSLFHKVEAEILNSQVHQALLRVKVAYPLRRDCIVLCVYQMQGAHCEFHIKLFAILISTETRGFELILMELELCVEADLVALGSFCNQPIAVLDQWNSRLKAESERAEVLIDKSDALFAISLMGMSLYHFNALCDAQILICEEFQTIVLASGNLGCSLVSL